MIKYLIQFAFTALFAFAFSTNNSNAQAKFIWGKQSGTDREEYVLNHVTDAGGNIYVSGKTTGTVDKINSGKNDGFLIKLDSTGNKLWSKQFGTAGEEDILWSAIDQKGCVYITGTTTGKLGERNFGKEDIFVLKYDPEGNVSWIKQFGTDSADISKSIYADQKGSVYITGSTAGNLSDASKGKSDAFLMKIDGAGNKIWTKQFGTEGDDMAVSVDGDGNSKIFVCGTTWGRMGSGTFGMIDAFAGVFNDKGEVVRMTQFGTDGFDIALLVKADENMNLYVGGSTSGNLDGQQAGEGDCFLTKIDAAGKILWNKQFGTAKHDGVRGLALNKNITDNILVSGIMNLPPSYAYIRMYSPDGRLLLDWNYGAGEQKGETSGKDVTIDNNGNIFHLGLTGDNLYSKLFGEHDFYLVKLKLESRYWNHWEKVKSKK